MRPRAASIICELAHVPARAHRDTSARPRSLIELRHVQACRRKSRGHTPAAFGRLRLQRVPIQSG
eukprot:7657298-Alexandrium_andersonii.AAC.1